MTKAVKRRETERNTHTHTEVQVDDRLKSLKHNIYTAAKQTKSVLYCSRSGKIMESSGFYAEVRGGEGEVLEEVVRKHVCVVSGCLAPNELRLQEKSLS